MSLIQQNNLNSDIEFIYEFKNPLLKNKIISIINDWCLQKPSETQLSFLKDLLKDLSIEDFSIEDLTKEQTYNMIYQLRSLKKISDKQIHIIKKYYTLDSIKQIIKEDITDFSDLTLINFKKLIHKLPQTIFKNAIANYIPKRYNIPLIYSSNHEIGLSRERYFFDSIKS